MTGWYHLHYIQITNTFLDKQGDQGMQYNFVNSSLNPHTTMKINSHFYLHSGAMDPKNLSIWHKRKAKKGTTLGCIVSWKLSIIYTEEVMAKYLPSCCTATTEVYPVQIHEIQEYM